MYVLNKIEMGIDKIVFPCSYIFGQRLVSRNIIMKTEFTFDGRFIYCPSFPLYRSMRVKVTITSYI